MSDERQNCTVAVIGAGNMAREHIRAFADVPGVTIAGIHSRTRSRAEELAAEYEVGGVFDSVQHLYERTEADLVVVTASETAMLSVGLKCMEFPWTTLLEKPPGLNLSEAEEIRRAARDHGRKTLVALNRRFLSSTRSACADLAQYPGTRFIVVQDQEDQPQARAMGHPDTVVDQWMYANSIHVVDYLTVFGRGGIKAVTPVVPWRPSVPGIVVATVEFHSGDLGLYQGIWNGPGPWAVSVSTPQMRWEMRPPGAGLLPAGGRAQVGARTRTPLGRGFQARLPAPGGDGSGGRTGQTL